MLQAFSRDDDAANPLVADEHVAAFAEHERVDVVCTADAEHLGESLWRFRKDHEVAWSADLECGVAGERLVFAHLCHACDI